jgi:hypothetical protein
MNNYQKQIVEDLKTGAVLQCTEGENYRCWLVYPDGKHKNIRRDSANKICSDYENHLIFGQQHGIKWKTFLIKN